jgi:hypothetical protein
VGHLGIVISAFGHAGAMTFSPRSITPARSGHAAFVGAGCPNRTDDLPLTRRVLYQLS